MVRIVAGGVIKIIADKQKKRTNYSAVPNSSSGNLTPFTSEALQIKPASNNFLSFAEAASNFDKPAPPQVQFTAPPPQPAAAGLTTNSSLKAVHVTADGTTILTDGQNNYYSLPPNNARNNRENVLRGVTKPAENRQSPRRNRVRSRN